MQYEAKAVANTLLDLADAMELHLTPMKLQKLVYYAHGWHLGLRGEALINEQVEAWNFGPVIPSLYHEFKGWGDRPILGRATCDEVVFDEDGTISLVEDHKPEIPLSGDLSDTYVRGLVNRILEVYGRYSGIQLSNMTHASGTPWDRVRTKYEGRIPKGTDIPQEWIKEHFQQQANEPRPA
jgi:uncharacterized phage-associated protein